MKILICGDRNWDDKESIKNLLKKFSSINAVVHGAARGADRLAGEAAKELGLEVISVPADWEHQGKAAGPIRNRKMLEEHPDILKVWAFHDTLDESKGTKDMVMVALKTGKEVYHWRHKGDILELKILVKE